MSFDSLYVCSCVHLYSNTAESWFLRVFATYHVVDIIREEAKRIQGGGLPDIQTTRQTKVGRKRRSFQTCTKCIRHRGCKVSINIVLPSCHCYCGVLYCRHSCCCESALDLGSNEWAKLGPCRPCKMRCTIVQV